MYCAQFIFKNIAGTFWAACSRVLEKLIVTQIGRNFLFFTVPRESLPRLPEGCSLSLMTSVYISHPKIHHNKGEKGKVFSLKVMNTYGGSRGIASLILNLSTGWRWVVGLMPRLLKSPTKEHLWIEGWLGAGVRLFVLGEEKNLMPLQQFKPQIIIWP